MGEKRMRSSDSGVPQLQDVPELIHLIQSRMPVKTAARTSVLSKSWLQAWSTIPTLRFDVRRGMGMKFVDVDRTLNRYLRDNIPIEKFGLKIDIKNQESASHVEKWIRPVATKTSLKQLFLSVILYGASFALPDEILSGENLTKIRLTSTRGTHSVWMATPVINCVSLRELYLDCVRISEEALHEIFSSCSLLVKIVLLHSCKGHKTIKVKNLPHLYELRIEDNGCGDSTALQISDVPKLGVFSYDLHVWHPDMLLIPFNAHSISLGSSRVTRLWLGRVIKDNACLDMIKTGFLFLQSLTLVMTSWILGSFHFTCASIKILSLRSCPDSLIDVQVHAPRLLSFEFGGKTLPSLLFPVSSPLKRITVSLTLKLPVDASFFLKMREALTLSHKCYLDISTINSKLPLDINIDDLRKRLLFPPATNVQQLSFKMIPLFKTIQDECLWEQSPFFDAFFEICHPKHVLAAPDVSVSRNNHFCRLMLSEVLEKKKTGTALWPHYLQDVQIREDRHQKWETLTNSHMKFLDGSAPDVYMHFKLIWR